MSPNSVILYIFYSKTIKQCLAFIAGLKINHSGYEEETGFTVPIGCLWLELGKLKLSSTQRLVRHIHTYSIYREITGLQSFLVQFPSFKITDYLSYTCMVHTPGGKKKRKARKKKRRIGLGFVFISGER